MKDYQLNDMHIRVQNLGSLPREVFREVSGTKCRSLHRPEERFQHPASNDRVRKFIKFKQIQNTKCADLDISRKDIDEQAISNHKADECSESETQNTQNTIHYTHFIPHPLISAAVLSLTA